MGERVAIGWQQSKGKREPTPADYENGRVPTDRGTSYDQKLVDAAAERLESQRTSEEPALTHAEEIDLLLDKSEKVLREIGAWAPAKNRPEQAVDYPSPVTFTSIAAESILQAHSNRLEDGNGD